STRRRMWPRAPWMPTAVVALSSLRFPVFPMLILVVWIVERRCESLIAFAFVAPTDRRRRTG
ncbi:MAG: hypothetical protein AB7S98_10125, partial [Burkholderiaceae bacterium]